jgi:cold shock CspA family protein
MKKQKRTKMENSQFSHYKKWTTDEGYTFLAENKKDAKLYISKTHINMGDVKTLRELSDD